jgi:hypothetical protein
MVRIVLALCLAVVSFAAPDNLHSGDCQQLTKKLDKCQGDQCDQIIIQFESLGCVPGKLFSLVRVVKGEARGN